VRSVIVTNGYITVCAPGEWVPLPVVHERRLELRLSSFESSLTKHHPQARQSHANNFRIWLAA
jgi:hypothetical protein